MPKEIVICELQRPNPSVPWGFCIVGGKDQALTVKIGNVKRNTPSSRAHLQKMDYLNSINGRPVFNLTHGECVREIKNAATNLTLECERGDHIVPSFDEMFGRSKDENFDGCTNRKLRMGDDYYQNAMQDHGLGHLPQPPNFTTVGRLGIEVNQYNCPIEAYSNDTIEDMRDAQERGGLDTIANMKPIVKDKKQFDPSRSNAMQIILDQEGGGLPRTT